MANPSSDPLLLFIPPNSSSLPPTSELIASSLQESPQPEAKKPTRRNVGFYIEPPRLSPSHKKLYEPVPDSLKDYTGFGRDDLDSVVGEYPLGSEGNPSYYFVRFKDELARRLPAHQFKAQYSDLVDDYEQRKEEGLLEPFDSSSNAGLVIAHTFSGGSTSDPYSSQFSSPLSSLPSEEDVDRSDDKDFTAIAPTRRSTRATAGNKRLVQSQLPFSPKKLRSAHMSAQSGSDSGDDLGGYGQVDCEVEDIPSRRSGRSRKGVRSNLADDFVDEEESDSDPYHHSPRRKVAQKFKKKQSATSHPAYGHFRDINDLDFDPYDEEATEALRAHRDICEKCHKYAAHELLKAARKQKKGRRKSRNDDDEHEENDEERLLGLGGWVRCLKCPVAAHWLCLARTQRDEITRAARARDKYQWKTERQMDTEANDPPPDELPDRKELGIDQTTEFICAACMKGGTCLGCLEVAVEPDASIRSKQPLDGAPSEPIKADGASINPPDAPTDIEMADGTRPIEEEMSSKPPRELLFRCFSCKRLAHYEHLPNPDNGPWEDADLADYYQTTTGWRCADCASYVYPLDKILAWRPCPLDAIEPQSSDPPDPKSALPRQYLVKWSDRSYRRTQWVPHMWLVSTNFSKLKNFLTTGSKVTLLDDPVSDEKAADVDKISGPSEQPIAFESIADATPEVDILAKPKTLSLGPLQDAERRIPPAWKTIDRILDARFRQTPSKSKSQTRSKGTKKNAIVIDGDKGDLPLEFQKQLERAYKEGEQPDESFMEEVDEWLTGTKEVLSVKHIDQVVWAFIKWEDLGYEEATWDSPPRRGDPEFAAYELAFQRFVDSRTVFVKKTQKEVNKFENRVENGYSPFALKRDSDDQPDLGQNDKLKLMKFQIDGYNWLCDNWWNRQPSILADEMGLGKTVQIVTFLGTLIEKFKAAPALVVVPNSTITNWVREFSRWAPRLRVVPFYGESKARDVVIRYELFHGSSKKGTTEPKYHVLVTTYESVTNAKDFTAVFKSVPRWEVLVVDEGQRLKNDSGLLFKKLNDLKPIHRVIMTGTPLNNNIRELLNLMNFLDPDTWKDIEALEKEYQELNEDLVRQLHTRLKPYFLRRIKSEVLQLPPKNEVIVPVSMTLLQREIYRSILSQNLDVLKSLTQGSTVKGRPGTNKTNMNNMLMQLRKCIQHPYLISDDIEPRGLQQREAHEKLIDASAKLRLLKSLLPKLKARGHRVLLFSQFVIALDVVEDFLSGEGYKYLRLDGGTKQAARQKGMDEFNKPDSEIFIYLLTTRAGGVGINLYTADTVIIFDPDFNPHQDLQAIARSHRYGQQKTCLVFKLMVKDSAEERIMQAGKKKLVLDHLIVQKMDDDEHGEDDLKSILTFGAKALFEEGDQASKDIIYTDNDLDKLIEKTEVEGGEQDIAGEPGLKFSFAKVWAAEKDTLEEVGDAVPDTEQGDSWAQALELIAAAKDVTGEKEVTGRGVRRKAAIAVPYQQLDFVEGLEETPDKNKGKSKKKGRASKSGASSDSDVYTAVQGPGDDTDATTGSTDGGPEPPLKPRYREALPITFLPTQNKSTLHDDDGQQCGLCGQSHARGVCTMTDSPQNLVEFREILMNHASDEPWVHRKAAIEAIEQELHDRGQGHLLTGQPLKLVVDPQPTSTSAKTRKSHSKHDKAWKDCHGTSSSKVGISGLTPPEYTPRGPAVILPPRVPVVAHEGSTINVDPKDKGKSVDNMLSFPFGPPLPFPMLPSKRVSSPDPASEASSSKKQKQNGCPCCAVCRGPVHSIEDCPIVAEGSRSITKQIMRLSEDPSQARTVKKLKHIVKKQKRQQRQIKEVGRSNHEAMPM
ncbi:hypothetical protein PAXRUDRAFT_833992 [Paxillus rubicundulus Ve08.2h10]|uniref:DNA helicase n=1 Tax=Paxillus rubicundulus Ve08.2h10 TaxID=930991 RepID=A0A0D0CW00_9AGAM|nr:hypothetical protein PAXRUDRAFT_833992 [Paxillus rubicundulus Ve08.2h10]